MTTLPARPPRLNFGEERELTGLTITYGDKAPASAKAEYTTDGTTWTQFGSEVKPKAAARL